MRHAVQPNHGKGHDEYMKACAVLSPLTPRNPAGLAAGIYGANVAGHDWGRAALHHGTMNRYLFIGDTMAPSLPIPVTHTETSHDSPLPALPPHLTFADIMHGRFPRVDLQAFHNPNGGPGLHREAVLRRLLGSSAPATTVIHTISYADQEMAFIRLLLTDVHLGDAIVCTSEASRPIVRKRIEAAARLLQTDIAKERADRLQLPIVPLGVDTEFYTPADPPAKAHARHLLNLPQDKVIIMWMGRLSSQDKADLSSLLLALRDLATEGASVHLVIAGEDRHYYSAILRRMCSALGITNLVSIVRNLPDGMGPVAYHAADIFAAPTDNLQETFGLTVLEAMASGLPVVAADWDGHRDTVVNGETGFLIPTMWGNCTERIQQLCLLDQVLLQHHVLAETVVVSQACLTQRLRELVASQPLRQRMGQAALHRVETTFCWKQVISQYEHLWLELETVAAAARRDDSAAPAIGIMPYYNWFRHYASTALTDDDLIIAADPQAAYPPSAAVLDSPELQPYFDLSLAQAIIEYCAPEPRSVRTLAQQFSAVTTPSLTMMILWLCKHGSCRCLRLDAMPEAVSTNQ